MKNRIVGCLLFFIVHITCFAQNITVVGKVYDENNKPLAYAAVYQKLNPTNVCQTDFDGNYKLSVPANKQIMLIFEMSGYTKDSALVPIANKAIVNLNKQLKIKNIEITEVSVTNKRDDDENLTRINPKLIENMPGFGQGSVETSIKTMPGVVSRNEFSSQYNVHGGSYDENLMYVNDIMIFKPILIRSGQQEGLSFINPDLVSSITFSSGGFGAEYGDKMSSVLDIKYKKPTEFAASADVSLLGAGFHAEGCSKDKRFTAIVGARYKNNAMILNQAKKSSDGHSIYNPSFADIQMQLTYQLNKSNQLGMLGYFSQNLYSFIPITQTTTFGSGNQLYTINLYFQGHEKDVFTSFMGALWDTWNINDATKIKGTISSFNSDEHEAYDIVAEYNLQQTSSNQNAATQSSSAQPDSSINLSTGTYVNHARNDLTAHVLDYSLIAQHETANCTFSAGVDLQTQTINFHLNQWTYLDSAGYNFPYSDSTIHLSGTEINNIAYRAIEMSGFVQNIWRFQLRDNFFALTAGLRSCYKDESNELLFSPRAKLTFKPDWQNNWQFRLSAGVYDQPTFFNEMIGPDGTFYQHTKAQRSIHYLLGGDHYLHIWERPFKFTVESFYNDITNLIPYNVDNVKLQYFPEYKAHGFSKGLDMKLNGEFIKGTESWVSLSLMQAKEDIDGTNFGWTRMPTDQLINFGMFFQDYFPWDNSYKMSLTWSYGTNIPSNPPVATPAQNSGRIPAYSRVDIGFFKQILSDSRPFNERKYGISSLSAGIELLNVLDTYNVVSYLWIRDVQGAFYGSPTYLTGRLINLKLSAKI